jgi:hypothetical protein
MSYRSHVWSDVDPTRCGYFPRMLDGTFDYRAYVDWALKAPLPLPAPERRVRDSADDLRRAAGARLRGGAGAAARTGPDHLSTLFPEVAIKRVMEVRGADSVSLEQTAALVALWRGLLYDDGVARRGAGARAAAVVRGAPGVPRGGAAERARREAAPDVARGDGAGDGASWRGWGSSTWTRRTCRCWSRSRRGRGWAVARRGGARRHSGRSGRRRGSCRDSRCSGLSGPRPRRLTLPGRVRRSARPTAIEATPARRNGTSARSGAGALRRRR